MHDRCLPYVYRLLLRVYMDNDGIYIYAMQIFFSRLLPSWMVTDEGPMNLTIWAGPWLAIDSLPGFCQMIRIACMYNSLAKTHDQSTFCLTNQMTVHVCHKQQYCSNIYFILTIKLHR